MEEVASKERQKVKFSEVDVDKKEPESKQSREAKKTEIQRTSRNFERCKILDLEC